MQTACPGRPLGIKLESFSGNRPRFALHRLCGCAQLAPWEELSSFLEKNLPRLPQFQSRRSGFPINREDAGRRARQAKSATGEQLARLPRAPRMEEPL